MSDDVWAIVSENYTQQLLNVIRSLPDDPYHNHLIRQIMLDEQREELRDNHLRVWVGSEVVATIPVDALLENH
jgi:hypothetical protein